MVSLPRGRLGTWHRFAVAGALAAAVAGCTEDGSFSLSQDKGADADTVTVADRSVKLIERDVEAPDVFQVTDRALWDGRPSLGGVWVAHPDVKDPERVIIRNTENSKFVVGALFRRERDNPGPVMMVSSDAAAELGMLAGAPAEINVTALRREETPDPEAQAAAEAEDQTTGAVAAGGVAVAAATPEILDNAAADTASLEPLAGAAAAITAAEAEATGQGTSGAAPQATVVASGDDADKTFLQIGIFSQEDNADRAANVMRQAGLAPTVKTQSAEGRTFWRVVVGPADSVFARTAMLETARKEGFTDAFPVGD